MTCSTFSVQNGDLSLWDQPRLIIVLEGVLATVTERMQKRRFRKDAVLARNFHWMQLPIKRVVYLKSQWPDTSVEVITFIDQAAADEAAHFFDQAHVPVSAVSYRPFDRWVEEIKWQPDINTIFDSDTERVQRYGQRGYLVLRGEDFA